MSGAREHYGRPRLSQQQAPRGRTVRFGLGESEFAELEAAAARAGLARGAYAAESALAVARGSVTIAADELLPDALAELVRSAGLVRRIGVNLNQAVAKLNATGQRSGGLIPCAAESIRIAGRLDDAAGQVRKSLP